MRHNAAAASDLLETSRRDDTTFVGHGGSCPGYRTQLSMSNDDKIAVIFMTNGHEVSPGAYTQRVFDIVAPAIAKALDNPGGGSRPDPQLQKYVGRYDRPLAGGDLVEVEVHRVARGVVGDRRAERAAVRREARHAQTGRDGIEHVDVEERDIDRGVGNVVGGRSE